MAVYEININFGGKGKIGNDKSGLGEENDKTKVPSKTDKQTSAVKSLTTYVASKTIEPFIQQSATHITQSISMVTGRRSVSEKINLGMQMAQKTVSTVSTCASVASITSMAGMGGPVGVAIGLAVTALSAGINLAFKNAEIQQAKALEDLQIAMLKSRAGINVNRSRMGV